MSTAWERRGNPTGAAHGNTKNLVGHVFGKLTVVAFARRIVTKANRALAWSCICECGEMKEALGTNLTSGKTRSCGCATAGWIGDATRTHGKRNSSEYWIWCHLRQRCLDLDCREYPWYGGRGISVCQDWLGESGFANFLAHIGPRPSPSHSIDRFPDNDGNYEPGNVRWATATEQANNKSNNVRHDVDGESLTVAEIARRHGGDVDLLRYRLGRGWSLARALSEPSRIKRRHPDLTDSERELVIALRATMSIAAVAAAIGISASTVKNVMRAANDASPAKETA